MLAYPSRPMIMMERKRKSNFEQAPNCPRCASTNTKFCYYNNYSLSQPRYFCKACRRYWTKGGSLRNVPVGGGCRKSRRSRSARKDDNTLQIPSPDLSGNEAAGADIDLADVFTKYLNQGTSNNVDHQDTLQESPLTDQDYSSLGASYDNSPSSDSLVPNSFETESQLDDTIIMGNYNQDYPCGFLQEEQLHEGTQDFLDLDPSFLEMQAMLGDEIIGQAEEFDYDASFTWQPMMQFQDFGAILEDDQLKTSTEYLANDNNNKPGELLEIGSVLRDEIPVVKRFTGGGTVVVDHGTLFITFICNKDAVPSVQPYPRPIMSWSSLLYEKVFQGVGDFSLRENDYVFGNHKFGGNAQSITKGRWIHHTSFLWDYEMMNMAYLKLPKRAPDYRQARDHLDFICRMKDYISRQEFIERTISVLDSHFTVNSLELESFDYPDDKNFVPSSKLLGKQELEESYESESGDIILQSV